MDGVCKLDVNAVFVPKHNPNLTFRTPKLMFALLSQLTHSSYRDVQSDLKNYNICDIGVSTLKDLAEREGTLIRASFNEQRSNILMKHDFNPDTGRPNNEAALVAACKNAPKSLELSKLAQAVQEFNKNQPGLDDKSNLIRSLRFINTIENSKELIVQIDIDEVLTKKQKFDRNRSCVNTPAAKATGKTRESQIQLNQNKIEARSDKKKEFDALAVSAYQNEHRNVNTAVIRVTWDGFVHVIKGESVTEALKSLMALLLENNLLTTRRLVFFMDGAKSLKSKIKDMFSFASYHIILDWYHVSVSVLQHLSMALSGTIAQKREHRSEVCKHIWHGNLQYAREVILNFQNKGIVRNKAKLQTLLNYLYNKQDELTCYALRKDMNLSNSSSQAEKYNDILVASRQKHNGMAWSVVGSNDLSSIKAAKVNNKLYIHLENPTKNQWFKVCDACNEVDLMAA